MDKIDCKKDLKHLYKPSSKVISEVDVPEFKYLMIDGEGDPNNSQSYSEAVEALFSVSYAAKFKMKKGDNKIDYVVMPLEGLWWADDMSAFTSRDKSSWKWTMMIMQPDILSDQFIMEAIHDVDEKKGLPGLSRIRLERLTEGHCAQILHIGPFDEEGPTIDKLHEYIDSRTGRTGKHHEIYLSDIRRADPNNWKTVIRHPMK